MLLAIDIGNTDFTIGVFQGKKLCDTFRMRTKINRTSDEYGVFILNTLQYKGYDTKDVEDVIIASVVPAVMHSFNSAIIKYFGLTPIIVGPGIRTGIRIATTNPKETGADRIVDAVAGYELYGGPVIVVDFGTATTYDLVTEDGRFVGGVTSPGIRTSANALWQQAAKLPEIEIRKPQYILAKDTVTSMQGGLVYGYIGQTEYIIRKMKEESGLGKINVVATGGLGKMIAQETSFINYYDKGCRLFEVDLTQTSDGVWVCRHNWKESLGQWKGEERKVLSSEEFLNTPIYGKYTPMTFEDLLKLLDEYPDAFVMIDSKQYSVRNYQRTLEDYAQYREISIKAGIEHTLKQIIPEIYNSAMYPGTALLYKFPAYIYSLWQEYTTEELNDIAEFCQTNKIMAVTIYRDYWSEGVQKIFDERDILVYIYTINDKEEARRYLANGAQGVCTDVLITDNLN